MPLEAPFFPIPKRVEELNIRYRDQETIEVLSQILKDPMIGPVALVSSFGADSVVLLHLVSTIDPTTPVIFIDTQMLFKETLAYQIKLAEDLGLSDVRRATAAREQVFLRDSENLLHLYYPDDCCTLRKTEPLQQALTEFDAWITGRKRYQGGVRSELGFFENEDDQRIKINPLVNWTREDIAEYIRINDLPRHPLVSKGYPSIGCEPCTTSVSLRENDRAGRWRGGVKTECGIHLDSAGTVSRKRAAI